jgi:potassium efflux system protein
LKFQLICFVDDVEMAERVKSEVNFELLRRLKEANVRIAYPYPTPAPVKPESPEEPPSRSA